jgi:DNA adenine methylase
MTKNKRRNVLAQPFLKWAGGKRYLLPEIKKRLPKFKMYHEPFLGGGAVLFALQPKHAKVNDLNSEIINVYKAVKDNVESLIKELKQHKNSSKHFYETRKLDREEKDFAKLTDIQKAARIIYLNKTCFNGLFRVNSQGQFNAPFGNYKNPNFVNEEVLKASSKYLKDNEIEIQNKSFEKMLSEINSGDFVYLDPPYDPVSDTASFTGYNLDKFGREEQEKLKTFCDEISKKGAHFLLSNSATVFIKDLYRVKGYKMDIVKVPRMINSDASKRGKIDEVLVRNYDL